MYSDRPSPSPEDQFDSEAIPTLQRKTIHPDSLKFMDMAKDLLDKPEIKQAITEEQQKQK
ncbi:hypothetical protein [Chroococcidiopsis sp. TS-821]|uniref:hypothetical protein n=1 Tax=Chroococcidiopsis sp. TS-821 TaxID=1378066 RepID=UPI000CEDB8C2|nr:hypothetical protein [Chroococcidiopsis sp. TS-821]PPS40676.1 hypothetical protein B1A85_19560 [Chroococcidiopsis sp. TS-821]